MFVTLFGGRSDDAAAERPGRLLMIVLGPIAGPGADWRSAAAASSRPTRRARSSRSDPLRSPARCARSSAVAAALPLPRKTVVTHSHLMIANPFRAQGLANLFSSHPPMAQRSRGSKGWPGSSYRECCRPRPGLRTAAGDEDAAMARLLFTCRPLAGHYEPLVPLAAAARDAGHAVAFATGSPVIARATEDGFDALPAGLWRGLPCRVGAPVPRMGPAGR